MSLVPGGSHDVNSAVLDLTLSGRNVTNLLRAYDTEGDRTSFVRDLAVALEPTVSTTRANAQRGYMMWNLDPPPHTHTQRKKERKKELRNTGRKERSINK